MRFDESFNADKLELEGMKEGEIVDTLFNSLVAMKKIELVEKADHEAGASIIKLAFDKIKKDITYDKSGTSLTIYAPAIDETNRALYNRIIFVDSKNDIIPEKNFFVKVYPKLKVKPLGLMELTFWGGRLERMNKDFKNLPPIRVFEQTEYSLYDYKIKEMISIDSDVFEGVRIGLSKGKLLDELLEEVDSKTQVLIREYLKREDLLVSAQEKINPFAEQLQMTYLDHFKNDGYDKIVVSGTLKKNPKCTTKDMLDYLKRYKDNVNNKIFNWLKVKLIFSTVTMAEYEKLEEKLFDDLKLINELEQDISTLEKPENVDWNEFVSKEDAMWNSEGKIVLKVTGSVAKLRNINIPRPLKFNKQLPMDGYIGFDLEKNELYPNLAELENRRYLKEEYSSIFEVEKYKELVLDSQRKK